MNDVTLVKIAKDRAKTVKFVNVLLIYLQTKLFHSRETGSKIAATI